MKKVNTTITYTNKNKRLSTRKHVIVIRTISWERVSFMSFIKEFFYCQRNLWFDAHISTGVIGFLNDSVCNFVEFVLHCSI